jgi:hypothetical protein
MCDIILESEYISGNRRSMKMDISPMVNNPEDGKSGGVRGFLSDVKQALTFSPLQNALMKKESQQTQEQLDPMTENGWNKTMGKDGDGNHVVNYAKEVDGDIYQCTLTQHRHHLETGVSINGEGPQNPEELARLQYQMQVDGAGALIGSEKDIQQQPQYASTLQADGTGDLIGSEQDIRQQSTSGPPAGIGGDLNTMA